LGLLIGYKTVYSIGLRKYTSLMLNDEDDK
jgi:hypothetical protein